MSFWFSKEDIIYLHSTILMKTGGEDGIRDEGMLESALATPLLTFDFNDLYPTIIDKLACLSFGLVMNHPFLDGNKRIGAYTLIVGLKLNKIPFSFDDDDAIEEFFALADGKINYDSFKIGFVPKFTRKAISLFVFFDLAMALLKTVTVMQGLWK